MNRKKTHSRGLTLVPGALHIVQAITSKPDHSLQLEAFQKNKEANKMVNVNRYKRDIIRCSELEGLQVINRRDMGLFH